MQTTELQSLLETPYMIKIVVDILPQLAATSTGPARIVGRKEASTGSGWLRWKLSWYVPATKRV